MKKLLLGVFIFLSLTSLVSAKEDFSIIGDKGDDTYKCVYYKGITTGYCERVVGKARIDIDYKWTTQGFVAFTYYDRDELVTRVGLYDMNKNTFYSLEGSSFIKSIQRGRSGVYILTSQGIPVDGKIYRINRSNDRVSLMASMSDIVSKLGKDFFQKYPVDWLKITGFELLANRKIRVMFNVGDITTMTKIVKIP